MKDNIVLIGMPGVGKSTVGVILAKIMGYQFVDMDLVIQQVERKLLHQIIKEQGVEGFLAVEARENRRIRVHQAVIATGGSVVYEKDAMEHLRDIGTVVYLRVPFSTLDKRLKDIKGRGVVLRDGQDLRAIYEERTPMYEAYADIIVEEEGLLVEETVELLLNKIGNL